MYPSQFLTRGLFCVCAALLGLPAHATLGEAFLPQSPKLAKAVGELRATPRARYTVNEYTLASKTVVREYAAPGGNVFAVSWQGPFIPDLRQLLGRYFDRYAATAADKSRAFHHPVSLKDPHLVIQATGHMRAFSGVVYLPDQLPVGLTENELQ